MEVKRDSFLKYKNLYLRDIFSKSEISFLESIGFSNKKCFVDSRGKLFHKKNIFIDKREDDWFLVTFKSKENGSKLTFYLFDGFDKLKDFLNGNIKN